MRWSQSLIPTSKDNPADAPTTSHQLLLRAGYIRQRAAGLYDFLPLGLRVLHKLESLLRSQLAATGALEVRLPTLQPAPPDHPPPPDAFPLKDQRGRHLLLPPTSLPAACDLAAATLRSHRQLPVTLFHLGPRHCDEPRPRNALLLLREHSALEIYSFTATDPVTDVTDPIRHVLSQLKLPAITLQAEYASEILLPSPAGDDYFVTSTANDYTSPLDLAQTAPRPWTFGGDPTADLQKVHTPNTKTVTDVARLLNVTPADVLKTLVFRATPSAEWSGYDTPENLTSPLWVIAVVRGDHELSLPKLAAAARDTFHISSLTPADETATDEFPFGYVGPDIAINKLRAVLIIDPDAAQNRPWVAGANLPDHHVTNFHWFRECGQPLADPRKVAVADIRTAITGDPSPTGSGTLQLSPAISLATTTTFTRTHPGCPPVTYQNEQGTTHPASLIATHLHLSRLLAAVVETHHDAKGIRWPSLISPYSVLLTPIQYTGPTKDAADRLYAALTAANIDTLLDDRDLRAGPKFADADLLGIPLRINLSDRGLAAGTVELKQRTSPEVQHVPLDSIVQALEKLL